MKIVSLAPYLTQLLYHFGLEQSLVGVTRECEIPDALPAPDCVSSEQEAGEGREASPFGNISVNITKIAALLPELVIAHIPGIGDNPGLIQKARAVLKEQAGENCALAAYDPRTLEQIFQAFENLGRVCGVPEKGLALVHRVRAQVMNWADNFYERMKNKRVIVVTSLNPLLIGGLWIPDMIHMASAVSLSLPGQDDRPLEWSEVKAFRPDVVLVAPRELSLKECLKQFQFFDKFPEWENLPAVKRGEVFFADGSRYLNSPGPLILESMGILISAIAGFESGYITERDIFYRLRWLELHRHRLEQ